MTEAMTIITWVIIIVCLGSFLACFGEHEETDQDLEERKKAYEELRYDRKKEGEFWRYFVKRKNGKLLYVVPEFEERIVKMNKLKN